MTKIVGSNTGLSVEGTELFSYVHILFRPQNDPFMNKEYPRKIKILYITYILRTSSRSSRDLINAARSRTSKPARRAMVSKQGLLALYSASCGMEDVSFEMLASWTGSVSKCACLHLSESDKLQLLL